jgi:MerR family transcriptional regulator, redox-sensitive transcriptional activator SoxR
LNLSVLFEAHFKSRGQIMTELTIGEVARQAGIQTSAIRYYERLGLLQSVRRVNGHRRYDPGVFQSLTIIRFAQQAGYTLAEIQTLLHGFDSDTPPSTRWRSMADQKLLEIEQLIERAQKMKQLVDASRECGCQRFEDCAQALDCMA